MDPFLHPYLQQLLKDNDEFLLSLRKEADENNVHIIDTILSFLIIAQKFAKVCYKNMKKKNKAEKNNALFCAVCQK